MSGRFYNTSHVFVMESEEHRRQMLGFLKSLQIMPDRAKWRVTIEPDSDKRSGQQHRRMWSLFGFIAEHAWVKGQKFPKEAWHDYYACKFIGWTEMPDGGRSPLHTSDLNTKQHNGFVDQVIADAGTEFEIDFIHWEP